MAQQISPHVVAGHAAPRLRRVFPGDAQLEDVYFQLTRGLLVLSNGQRDYSGLDEPNSTSIATYFPLFPVDELTLSKNHAAL